MIYKCCRNFMVLVITAGDILLTPDSPTSWYVLYAPNSGNPQLIYHRRGSQLHAGYSTTKQRKCDNPQSSIVGRCASFFGCVEDTNASFGNGELGSAAGFSTLNNLTGRFKTPVSNLYDQRECFCFIKYEGQFKDESDVSNSLLGKVIFRPVMSSKLVPQKVFGQAFEATWTDNGRVDLLHDISERLAVILIEDKRIGQRDRRLSFSVSGSGSLLISFSAILLGDIQINTGFTKELKGRNLLISLIPGSGVTELIIDIRNTDQNNSFTLF